MPPESSSLSTTAATSADHSRGGALPSQPPFTGRSLNYSRRLPLPQTTASAQAPARTPSSARPLDSSSSPSSVAHDVPPVPALPAAFLTRRRQTPEPSEAAPLAVPSPAEDLARLQVALRQAALAASGGYDEDLVQETLAVQASLGTGPLPVLPYALAAMAGTPPGPPNAKERDDSRRAREMRSMLPVKRGGRAAQARLSVRPYGIRPPSTAHFDHHSTRSSLPSGSTIIMLYLHGLTSLSRAAQNHPPPAADLAGSPSASTSDQQHSSSGAGAGARKKIGERIRGFLARLKFRGASKEGGGGRRAAKRSAKKAVLPAHAEADVGGPSHPVVDPGQDEDVRCAAGAGLGKNRRPGQGRGGGLSTRR